MAAVAEHGPLKKRNRLNLLRSQLDTEYQSFHSFYRDLAENILPTRQRFTVTDWNKGDRRNTRIFDGTATSATRILSAGMMGGVTSPARPWFRLSTPIPEMNEYAPVKHWLHTVQSRMSWVFLRSNLYNSLPIVYTDMPTFATAAMLIEDDWENVIHTTVFPVGSYRLAADRKGRVNTFYREFQLSVQSIVDEFGKRDRTTGKVDWSNISTHVKMLYDQGSRNSRVTIAHIIYPNDEYDDSRAEAKYKKFASCYFEVGGSVGDGHGYLTDNDLEKYLRESGYDYFPVLCPRWGVTGEDVYGTSCPGMDALGDIKELQKREKRIAEAEDKVNRPPTTGPSHLLQRGASTIPGGFTAHDGRSEDGIRSVYQINPQLQYMEQKQQQRREFIQNIYFVDMFLAINRAPNRDRTAREVQEMHEEKLLMLGPVLEQLNQDLLNPLIDITFDEMLRRRMLPEPPEELKGMPLRVEYTSIMAQAQKLLGVSSIERYFGFIGGLIAMDPGVRHKVNFDEGVDEIAEALGVAPRLTRTDEEAAELRQAEAEAAQAKAQMEAMAQASQSAKNLSQSQTTGENALADMLSSGGSL